VTSWFYPGLLDHQKQRKGKETNSQASFHSDTERLQHALFYFQHQKSDKLDWAYTPFGEIGEMMGPDQDKPNGYYVTVAWFKV
jgi:hypothetical protein